MGSLVILSIFLVEVRGLFVVIDDGRSRHPQHLPRVGESFVGSQHLCRVGEDLFFSH